MIDPAQLRGFRDRPIEEHEARGQLAPGVLRPIPDTPVQDIRPPAAQQVVDPARIFGGLCPSGEFMRSWDTYADLKDCRVRVGHVSQFGGESMSAELPWNYQPSTNRAEMFRDFLPVWNANVFENESFSNLDAEACIDFRRDKTPGRFWDEGMLFECTAMALRTLFSYAELIEIPTAMVEANQDAGWRMANLRKNLQSADWRVVVGDPTDGPICTADFQAFVAFLLLSTSIPAPIAAQVAQRLANYASDGDDAYIGNCCEESDVYLYRNVFGRVGAGEVEPGVRPLTLKRIRGRIGSTLPDVDDTLAGDIFDAQWLSTDPGAWTPFRGVRLCGEFSVLAILADYWLSWAQRLHSRWTELGQSRPVGAVLDPAASTPRGVGPPDHEFERVNARRVGIACARIGLAYVVNFTATLVHEFGHATPNILSPIKVHCRTPEWAAALTQKFWFTNARDRWYSGCFQFMYQYTFYFRALAEFGLPEPVEKANWRDPPRLFNRAASTILSAQRNRSCDNLGGSSGGGAMEFTITALTCGIWPRRRPVRLTYEVPTTCLPGQFEVAHESFFGSWNEGNDTCGLLAADGTEFPGGVDSQTDCETACELRFGGAFGSPAELVACLADCAGAGIDTDDTDHEPPDEEKW